MLRTLHRPRLCGKVLTAIMRTVLTITESLVFQAIMRMISIQTRFRTGIPRLKQVFGAVYWCWPGSKS